jgi:hypothetical protein
MGSTPQARFSGMKFSYRDRKSGMMIACQVLSWKSREVVMSRFVATFCLAGLLSVLAVCNPADAQQNCIDPMRGTAVPCGPKPPHFRPPPQNAPGAYAPMGPNGAQYGTATSFGAAAPNPYKPSPHISHPHLTLPKIPHLRSDGGW